MNNNHNTTTMKHNSDLENQILDEEEMNSVSDS